MITQLKFSAIEKDLKPLYPPPPENANTLTKLESIFKRVDRYQVGQQFGLKARTAAPKSPEHFFVSHV